MRSTLLILLILAIVACSSARFLPSKVGEKVILTLSKDAVNAFTRKMTTGDIQTFSITGKNKEVWVDKAGRPLASTNFAYQAPGTLIIKKVTKADAATYNFIPKNAATAGKTASPNADQAISLVVQ